MKQTAELDKTEFANILSQHSGQYIKKLADMLED